MLKIGKEQIIEDYKGVKWVLEKNDVLDIVNDNSFASIGLVLTKQTFRFFNIDGTWIDVFNLKVTTFDPYTGKIVQKQRKYVFDENAFLGKNVKHHILNLVKAYPIGLEKMDVGLEIGKEEQQVEKKDIYKNFYAEVIYNGNNDIEIDYIKRV